MQEYEHFVHKIIILEPIDFYHNTLVLLRIQRHSLH